MKHKKPKIVVVFVLLCSMLFITTISCYADSIWKDKDFDLTEFQNGMSGIFKTMRSLAVGIAGLGVAIGGWNCIVGGAEGYQKGIRQVKYSIFALIVFFLLPVAIQYGMGIGQEHGWKLPE